MPQGLLVFRGFRFLSVDTFEEENTQYLIRTVMLTDIFKSKSFFVKECCQFVFRMFEG